MALSKDSSYGELPLAFDNWIKRKGSSELLPGWLTLVLKDKTGRIDTLDIWIDQRKDIYLFVRKGTTVPTNPKQF